MEIINLNLFVNKKHLLKNISFNINKNDKIGIIGKNGSGKTLLLRSLAGIYFLNNTIINDKIDFYFLSSPSTGTHWSLSLYDNAKRIFYFNNQNFFPKNSFLYYLNKFDLIKYVNSPYKILSQGQRVRFQIIIFYLMKFKNILLDEFIGFGDKYLLDDFKIKLYSKLSSSNCLLIASHNMKLIHRFCNRIIKIDEGTIVDDYKINRF